MALLVSDLNLLGHKQTNMTTPEPRNLNLLPRIIELKQALFFNYSDAVLKLPTSVVNALHVDEVGQVWFILHRPTQNLNEFDDWFSSRLEFYKKGMGFHMHVSGKACLVTDPEEINNAFHITEEIRQQVNSSMVLVKLKAEHVEYFPHQLPRNAKVLRLPASHFQPSGFFKTLQYIVKDIIPVFQSH